MISHNQPNEHAFKTLIDEMKVRGFSIKTIKSYLYINQRFLHFIKKSPKNVLKSDIEKYIVFLYDNNISSATRSLVSNALKFYYENVLKRRFNLKHPKKSNRLPAVLNKNEILRMIESLPNPKHKLLLELMYGSGLRVGEAIKIKIEDFDTENKILNIRKGKGDKDRIVNLSERFISHFLKFTKIKSSIYLFESEHNFGKHITERTAQQIVKNALRKANITKNAHPHTFRTSFATHLIENGIDISYVQKLLGHSNLSTTQAYIRLSQNSIRNIKSPLDD